MKKNKIHYISLIFLGANLIAHGETFEQMVSSAKKGLSKAVSTTQKGASQAAGTAKKELTKATSATQKGLSQAARTIQAEASRATKAIQKGLESGVSDVTQAANLAVVQGPELFMPSAHPTATWQEPDRRLRLDQASFLGSHNALISQENGWTYAQQKWSLTHQLDHGIRSFEFDLGTQPGKAQLFVCHGSCKDSKVQKLGKASLEGIRFDTFQDKLKELAYWLKKHPREVAFVSLDNARDKAIKRNHADMDIEALYMKDVVSMILTTQDWDPKEHNGDWPTLQWMNDHGKQIVIFNGLAVNYLTIQSGNDIGFKAKIGVRKSWNPLWLEEVTASPKSTLDISHHDPFVTVEIYDLSNNLIETVDKSIVDLLNTFMVGDFKELVLTVTINPENPRLFTCDVSHSADPMFDSPRYTFPYYVYILRTDAHPWNADKYTKANVSSFRAFNGKEEERAKLQRFYQLDHQNELSSAIISEGYATYKTTKVFLDAVQEVYAGKKSLEQAFKTTSAAEKKHRREAKLPLNTREEILTVLNDCKKAGIMGGHKNPNFVQLDWTNQFVDDNGFLLINLWNAEAMAQLR